tara:strand:- start:700 stop:1440 length:741 start_codon:yes stop_codon:yes gene_type:complete
MRLLFSTIFILCVFYTAKANTIFYLTKIPNLKVYKLDTPNGIKYLSAEKPFKVGIVQNNVQCGVASDEEINKRFSIIKANFDKYEKDFLKKINLKYVVICKNLKVAGINTAGVPNHNVKTLIIDIGFNEKYFERSIHHELFHMVDDSFNSLFPKQNWEKFNALSFKYAKCSTCTNKLGLSLIKDTSGFLTEYSMSTASEDMAEIFSFLMTDKSKMSEITSNDFIINKKVSFLKNEILKIDDNFKFD